MLSESQEHNDLVVEDFHDVYLNLTMKTGFLLKWLNQECPRAKFVLKVCNLISLLVIMNFVGHQSFPYTTHFSGGRRCFREHRPGVVNVGVVPPVLHLDGGGGQGRGAGQHQLGLRHHRPRHAHRANQVVIGHFHNWEF